MNKLTITACLLFSSHCPLISATPTTGLDGALGRVFKVDLENQTFELLKATEFSPTSSIGKSRFTLHWDKDVRITQKEELKSFDQIDGRLIAEFSGINESESKALAAGKAFSSRIVTLFPGDDARMATGISKDQRKVKGWFTPEKGKGLRRGTIEINGQQVPVSLRKRYWRIYCENPVSLKDLSQGFWMATVHGEQTGDLFITHRMNVIPLDDPRKTDDPSLPRVLVIGDSISMNYHQAAKDSLKGIVNYHRNYGNSFSSAHGVLNSELWLGNYQQKGFHWDVIQFNHGLHDLKQAYNKETDRFGAYAIPIAQYKANLEKQIAILKKTGATLIWCTTTPVQSDTKNQYARRKGAAVAFNKAAMEVMKSHPDIIINDLHTLVSKSPVFKNWWQTTDVHFYKKEEQQALGNAVADAVKQALQQAEKK
ncbi:MAG: SGNH/GDSL hydrolase family protein [Verrucomicrobiae bacterium]|nr:SGNH/GDSL hydrolase family protein [Verrucomicrobiae bacterium]NNJ87751.1 SGNH/GDSL hydrolase family protein [Akkermansiaceae bacterium]